MVLLFLFGCSTSDSDSSNVLELEYPEYLQIVTRADWGWIPIDSSFKTHKIEYITVHHGGVEFSKDKNPIEHVLNLQTWGRKEKKWIDIPYHFMISPDGRIFETRPINIPGDTNTEYNPAKHALVEVMGNFEIQEINEKQLAAMIRLIKFLSIRFSVPLDMVKTHRDYSNMTVCPGKNIYKFFRDGSIKKLLTE